MSNAPFKIDTTGACDQLVKDFLKDFKEIMPPNIDFKIMLETKNKEFANQITKYCWKMYIKLYSSGRI